MASIYRRAWWVDGNGNPCRKGEPGAKRCRSNSHSIKIIFRGRTYRFKGYTDKSATEQLAAELTKKLERGEEGLVDPFAKHKARPLSEHVRDYTESLKSSGAADEHIYIIEKRLSKLMRECQWKFVAHVTPQSYEGWRLQQTKPREREDGGTTTLGPVTLNQYLQAANAFLNWCVGRERFGSNPLSKVGKLNEAEGIRRERRALSEDEATRLLNVAGTRKVVYLAALLTGLRRGELAALTWADINLDAPRPFLKARASTTKNGKEAPCWLRDDLVDALRIIRPSPVDFSAKALADLMPTMDQFRSDLGKAFIAEVDPQQRRVDFHSLRHTFGTELARAGVAPRVAQGLMRHSDPKLTNKTYTDETLLPMGEAVKKLPRYTPAVLRPTGTDGNHLRQTCVHTLSTAMHSQPFQFTIATGENLQFSSICRGNSAFSSEIQRGGETAPARART
jgi:integrase